MTALENAVRGRCFACVSAKPPKCKTASGFPNMRPLPRENVERGASDMRRELGAFEAIRTGHIRNAEKLLLETGKADIETLAMMDDSDVEAAISEDFVAVVYQSEISSGGYDDIMLIPKAVVSVFPVIAR